MTMSASGGAASEVCAVNDAALDPVWSKNDKRRFFATCQEDGFVEKRGRDGLRIMPSDDDRSVSQGGGQHAAGFNSVIGSQGDV
jgi:hypothetical protein